jgi:hypothetical protein
MAFALECQCKQLERQSSRVTTHATSNAQIANIAVPVTTCQNPRFICWHNTLAVEDDIADDV